MALPSGNAFFVGSKCLGVGDQPQPLRFVSCKLEQGGEMGFTVGVLAFCQDAVAELMLRR